MQWATTFYANHSLDGPMDACWSEKANIVIYRKVHTFLMVIIVSRTDQISNTRIPNEY